MSTLVPTTLTELVVALERENTVWVRLSADFAREEWTLRLLEITSSEAPPRWQEIDWRYPEFLFGAFAVGGPTAAKWLQEKQIRVENISIPAPFHESLSRERRESGWGSNYCEPLRWPSEEWQLSRTDSPSSAQARELISDIAPSFRSPDMATTLLLGVPYTGYNNSSREFVVRQQDLRGRLVSVRVDAADLTVSVEGEGLAGALIELSSTAPGPTERLDRSPTATVHFPLPEGLPQLAWVILRRTESCSTAAPSTGLLEKTDPASSMSPLLSTGSRRSSSEARARPRSSRSDCLRRRPSRGARS